MRDYSGDGENLTAILNLILPQSKKKLGGDHLHPVFARPGAPRPSAQAAQELAKCRSGD
jgi:hypothetical protein